MNKNNDAGQMICVDHQCINPPTPYPTKSPTKPPTKPPTPHPTKPPTKPPTPHPTKTPTPPPTVEQNDKTCRTKVRFTVTNNDENDLVTFKKKCGYGPNFIKFGNQKKSCTETKEVSMSPGTKYELVMCQSKGKKCKCFDDNNHHKTIVQNGQLKFSDDGGNTYTGLVIESDKCFFNGDGTNFELGSSYSCDFYYYSSNNRKNIAGKNQK